MQEKVLHCITVYNGRSFVPRAVESAMRMAKSSRAQVDVLILDDASPEPGWSEELEALCQAQGAYYYRTPRNLGIPRNVNIGLLAAEKFGYDYVVINNSDVIFPKNLINNLIPVASQPNVGSVTAWSNNVSVYSIPNADPDLHLANQDVVDRINDVCSKTFGNDAIDIPAGISFCIMIPVPVVSAVGIMDPCFGRGYCEETDWSLRSLAAGYRLCLAPGAFVYHQGRGSNQAAGLVSAGATTVPANEAIIDLRYPDFRTQVERFMRSGKLEALFERVNRAIIMEESAKHGYDLHIGWLERESNSGGVTVNLRFDSKGLFALVNALGFQIRVNLPEGDPAAALAEILGGEVLSVRLSDRDVIPEAVTKRFVRGRESVVPYRYPSRV